MKRARKRLSQRIVLAIFAKEAREILRDRRTVFVAFLLPLFFYPAAFLGVSSLSRIHERELEERTLSVGVPPSELWEIETAVAPGDRLELLPGRFEERDLREGTVAAAVEIAAPEDASRGTVEATVRYLAASAASREAAERVMRVLERREEQLVDERFASRGVDLRAAEAIRLAPVDVSTALERTKASLARWLAPVLVLLLLAGGAFAALDLVAGEKERGTLETLAIQAVTRAEIVAGKFLVVFATSLASVALNLAGFAAALAFGLGPEGGEGARASLPAGTLAAAVLLTLPLGVLTSALLVALSAYARSYREAQMVLLPVTLLALVPVLLSLSPETTTASIVALVPVGNVAVALREMLEGTLEPLPCAAVALSTALYAGFALRRAASLLEREEIVLGLEPQGRLVDVEAEARERRAVAFGLGALLAVYFAAPWLQSPERFGMVNGLILTLWILLPALTFGYVRWAGRSAREALALRRPRLLHLLASLAMAAGASLLVAAYAELQARILPAPESLARAFERLVAASGMNGLEAFLLLAVSPGITEELLWRGAFQTDAGARGRPLRTVVLVGVFFGMFHLSIYRLVPAGLLGALLAWVRLRTGSVWPCAVLHAAYNGSAVFLLPAVRGEDVLGQPLLLGAGAALLIAGLRLLRAPAAP